MEEAPNNFEQLLERQAKLISSDTRRQTEERLFKTFESLRLVGQLIDVFIPKMVDVLVVAAGGSEENGSREAKNAPPPPPPGPEGPKLPPGGEDEIR